MDNRWLAIIGALVALGASILGVGRFVGNIESRIENLERQQKFLHGSIDPREMQP